jgi:hypothetical protein
MAPIPAIWTSRSTLVNRQFAMGSARKLKSSKVAQKEPQKPAKGARHEFHRAQYETCKVMLKQTAFATMDIKMENSKK